MPPSYQRPLRAAAGCIYRNFCQPLPVPGAVATEPTPSQLDALMEYYAPTMIRYMELTKDEPKEIWSASFRQPTLAIALVTLDPERGAFARFGEAVDKFWIGALHDDAIARRDVRKRVFIHLLHTIQKENSKHDRGREVSIQESLRFLAKCFNIWIEKGDDPVTQVIPREVDQPIEITGVPLPLHLV